MAPRDQETAKTVYIHMELDELFKQEISRWGCAQKYGINAAIVMFLEADDAGKRQAIAKARSLWGDGARVEPAANDVRMKLARLFQRERASD